MKYLFFFNGHPLLLCCVCCKIAIQDFLTGLHKKNKKHLRFHRRVYRRTITRRYFTESCKKITGLCHNHRRICRRTITRRYFTESCKKLRDCATITDGVTDVYYRQNHWRIYAHHEAHTCLTRVRLHKYRRSYRRQIPTESPTALRTSRSARMCDTCPSARIPTDRKVWRDFWTFFGAHFN
jgi:hypothetical protein